MVAAQTTEFRMPDSRVVTCRYLVLIGIWALFVGFSVQPRAAAVTGASAFETYGPVAPAGALLHAMRLNLKVMDEWLGDGDFDSAAETADRVKLLLTFCEFQSRE